MRTLDIIYIIVFVSWIIVMFNYFFKEVKRIRKDLNLVAHVKCKKCGTQYDVKDEDYVKHRYRVKVSIKRPKMVGNAKYVDERYYYYAARFMCPTCNKKEMAQVINANEMNIMSYPPIRQKLLHIIIILCIGISVIQNVFGIFS